jgi:5-bromo-4-chloroindolyl phosphate hydrolysis protein
LQIKKREKRRAWSKSAFSKRIILKTYLPLPGREEWTMRQVIKKSAVPVYAIAGCWLIYALIFPLYKMFHFIIIAGISIVVYCIFSKVFPGKTVTVEEKQKPVRTGDREIDNIIAEGQRSIEEMRRLNVAIEDEKISAQIDALENISRNIFNYIINNPKKAPDIKKFMNYYLPTTIKLLKSFSTMASQGVRGKNIDETMLRIKKIMETIVKAFENQLDHLFSDEALDISTDIVVLEGMLAQEGLGGSDFKKQ